MSICHFDVVKLETPVLDTYIFYGMDFMDNFGEMLNEISVIMDLISDQIAKISQQTKIAWSEDILQKI